MVPVGVWVAGGSTGFAVIAGVPVTQAAPGPNRGQRKVTGVGDGVRVIVRIGVIVGVELAIGVTAGVRVKVGVGVREGVDVTPPPLACQT